MFLDKKVFGGMEDAFGSKGNYLTPIRSYEDNMVQMFFENQSFDVEKIPNTISLFTILELIIV